MPVISSVQVPFEKWQRRFIKFGSDEMVGHGYYKAIETGELYGPIDSNKRLAETPAIVLFDGTFPPGERMINDWLVGKQSLLLNAVDRVTTNRIMTIEDKIEIAQLLALHACRYPDLFGRRINIDRYYMNALHDVDLFSNYVAFNAHLRWGGFPPNTRLKVTEFKRLRAIPNNERDLAIDQILQARGYESVFDKRLLLVGDFPSAEQLLEFEWELIEASRDEFIFSDRPIPPRLATSTIALGISARIGICLKLLGTNDANIIAARAAQNEEVGAINAEVRQRAEKWVCGSDSDYL